MTECASDFYQETMSDRLSSSVGAHGRTGGQRRGNGGATNWGHGKRSLDENPYDAYDLWNKFQVNSA